MITFNRNMLAFGPAILPAQLLPEARVRGYDAVEEAETLEEHRAKSSDQRFCVETRREYNDHRNVPVVTGYGLEGKRGQVQKDQRVRTLQSLGKRVPFAEYDAVAGQIYARYLLDEATRVDDRTPLDLCTL
jgi:predicted nicotinamide N-methyase